MLVLVQVAELNVTRLSAQLLTISDL